MTNLISGKEAKLAWANGGDVEFRILSSVNHREWKDIYDAANGFSIQEFDAEEIEFRLKPRTIKLELEVPAPFEPKDLEKCWVLSTRNANGYGWLNYSFDEPSVKFGAWRTEEEIKQVVAALRQIFGRSDDAVNAVRGGK